MNRRHSMGGWESDAAPSPLEATFQGTVCWQSCPPRPPSPGPRLRLPVSPCPLSNPFTRQMLGGTAREGSASFQEMNVLLCRDGTGFLGGGSHLEFYLQQINGKQQHLRSHPCASNQGLNLRPVPGPVGGCLCESLMC